VLIPVALILAAGLVVFALSQLNLSRVGHALITASPGWIVLALVLMGSSLVLRSLSWHQTLRAALPETPLHMAWDAGYDDRRARLGGVPGTNR
jgi:phosphatidylinositol alpha-mannosyltransferase